MDSKHQNRGQWPLISNFLCDLCKKTTIRGCMQNFCLLYQLLGPNAACTKFGVTKCRIAPPPRDQEKREIETSTVFTDCTTR